MKNVKWTVDAAPTGPYRSFQKRCWPTAKYTNDRVAAAIYCPDDYTPRDAREGKHAPLTVRVADWRVTPWKWRQLKGTFTTLALAKAALENLLTTVPALVQAGLQE